MKKAYFLAPLLATLAFIGLYASYRGGMKERDALKAAEAKAALDAKLQAEQDARRQAMAEAIAAAEKRKEEKAAKEAREQAERAERQVAIDARDQAFREQEKTARQLERLQKDIETEQASLAKLQAEHKAAAAEREFLDTFVARAEGNARSLQDVLTRLALPAPTTTTAAK